jgi:hypothetical protein
MRAEHLVVGGKWRQSGILDGSLWTYGVRDRPLRASGWTGGPRLGRAASDQAPPGRQSRVTITVMDDSATDATDAVLDEIALLVPRLTGTLDTLSAIARGMHPPRITALVDLIGDQDAVLDTAVQRFRAAPWPSRLGSFRDQLANQPILP